MHRIAVLDDYQSVAATFADWSRVPEPVEVVVFHDHLADEDALVARLDALRRRRGDARAHAVPARPCSSGCPNLKLLVTTGMRNAVHRRRRRTELGIIVCGTGAHATGPSSSPGP